MAESVKEKYEKIMAKIKTLFEGVVSQEEIDLLKSYVKPEVTPVKLSEVKTKDGKTLSVEGELAVGSGIKEATPEGLVDLADGDYVLVDEAGVELPIKVLGGKIAEIATPAAEQTEGETEMQKQVSTLSTQLSEQKKAYEVKLSEQSEELKKLNEKFVNLSKIVDKIVNTPINLTEEKPEKKYEDMTAYERFVHDRKQK